MDITFPLFKVSETKKSVEPSCACHWQAKLGSPSPKWARSSATYQQDILDIKGSFCSARQTYQILTYKTNFIWVKLVHSPSSFRRIQVMKQDSFYILHLISWTIIFFSTDKSFSENSSFPLSLPKNVTDFFRLFLMNMFQKHIHILQTQHWCNSYFDKNMKILNKTRMISWTLPFSKMALLTAKHFDGKISERSHDFFLFVHTDMQ